MSVCSPYAVFTAAESPWALRPSVAPTPVVNLLALLPASRPTAARQRRKSGRKRSGNTRTPMIQGELFQLG
ncbi:MAG: hypothetical protein VKM92_08950 [Cyanobacteriota bacterium]|nr:hypothetical protein [Cyanobacteriota bacterium]